MDVTINVLECASELAHIRTLYESADICNNEDDMFKQEGDEGYDPDCLTYTEEVQDRFNSWYDFYYTEIMKLLV